ncbi:MAG: 16S rRNA (adenine(1518)-N(6)/adenine(1519)-N(6))-dimethyltransferase RsmA [Methanomicrobiales archaeon]|nr:16S rRNA (adenine(1518)-N(6)/adenine(1519)-N(6))-dimethyltransferase RsmA [Methanomicrobiales archaeon]
MSSPRWDQHFLIDRRAIERIVSLVDVRDRRVLEIGPGRGALTEALLDAGACVVAIELDPMLCEEISARFGSEIREGRLRLINGDATTCDLPDFEFAMANLPYSVSSRITFRLLGMDFREAILMYQKEFAMRMCAHPGTPEVGRLSIMAQTYADIQPCFELSPNAFSPKPQVRSVVLRITPHAPRFLINDRRWYGEVVKALFSHRRKTVRNGLKSLSGIIGRERLQEGLLAIPEDILSSRPEELQLQDFAEIANAIPANP